ncbi:TetR/AcrR family transcriptional regulator [Nocardiopsis composta]|uniref:AcrR family transcriptional regulator n=1 Tax=Nocardiopsis composta TaxID=157465 RepID=A0A7W8VDV4_9ACTN|nr:TetR/AcrR family transcriptional regulator [Nocardiopsis composta]MBB5432264.1 AcrR family transcriptional regulator [Nocardiopsis composta]
MTGITSAPERTAAGLRERKKARTRAALVSAALDLFCAHGFDATTTEEIAAAVGVSQRTLFRYFASKDEIVLSIQNDIESTFLEKVRARPLSEHPYTALVNAVRDAHRELDPDLVVGQLRVIPLYTESPRLLAARLAAGDRYVERLTALIAERCGVDPVADPRPALLAGTFGAAMHTASTSICRRRTRPDADTLFSTMEAHLEALVPALTEPWHSPAPKSAEKSGAAPPPQNG